jgi:NitT/TauT family transport system permease protein
VVGAIVGEFFFKKGNAVGIGRLLDRYWSRLQMEQLIGGVILASLMGVVLFAGFGVLSNKVLRAWKPARPEEVL